MTQQLEQLEPEPSNKTATVVKSEVACKVVPNKQGKKISKKYPKTRTGCTSCKRRKKKCNEEKPICSTCKRMNLPCSYLQNYQWPNGHQLVLKQNEIKQIEKYKRENKEEDNSNTVFHYYQNVTGNNKLDEEYSEYYVHFINVTRWDVSLAYHFNSNETLAEELLPKFHYESLLPEYELKKMFEMNELTKNSEFAKLNEQDKEELVKSYGLDEKFLFDYYYSRLVSKRHNKRSDHEFQSIIEKSQSESHALYNSILAYASQMLLKNSFHKLDVQHSNTTHLSICYYLSFKYKNLSINYLHDLVDSLNFESVSIKVYEELLTTIIMLCSLDIGYTGSISWVNHLKESCLLFSTIPRHELADTVLNNKLLLFAYKYFALRYILLITTMKDDKLRAFLITSPYPIIREVFNNDVVDQMFGCSPKLLYMIYKLTVLEYEDGFSPVQDGLYHSIDEGNSHCIENPLNFNYAEDHDEGKRQNRMNVKYLEFWNELIKLKQFQNVKDPKSDNMLLISKSYHNSLKIFFIHILIVTKRVKLFMVKSKIDFLTIYYTQLFPESLAVLEEIMKIQINEEFGDHKTESDDNKTNGNNTNNINIANHNESNTVNNDWDSPSSDCSTASSFTSVFTSSSSPFSAASLDTVSISFPLWSLLIVSMLITNTNNTEEKEVIRLKILHILKFLEIRDPLSSIFRLKRAIGIVWKVTDLSNNDSRMSSYLKKNSDSDDDEDEDSDYDDNDEGYNDLGIDINGDAKTKTKSRKGSVSRRSTSPVSEGDSRSFYSLMFNGKFDWRDILIEAGFNLALT